MNPIKLASSHKDCGVAVIFNVFFMYLQAKTAVYRDSQISIAIIPHSAICNSKQLLELKKALTNPWQIGYITKYV
jgi:hypothetical protein